ncbi:hypothetical protein J437_LFUL011811 [Ladona fulva]|uniref:Uncharacterized protein n=1 Tax=Ladona fulva TaxID=123851 RepID=A0A8K0K354_LADFU|nr:hypothetical protein J437_LFUL011811 [Ladona fulva]
MLLQQIIMLTSSFSICSTYLMCEICSVIWFLTLRNESAVSIHCQHVEIYISKVMNSQDVTKWVRKAVMIAATIEAICQMFARSPRKSVRCVSRELKVAKTTVWQVLWKCLHLRLYRLQMLQKLKSEKAVKILMKVLNMKERVLREKLYSRFFIEPTVTGFIYLDMLSEWLMPQLQDDIPDRIYQQDSVPPYFHNEVKSYLNQHHSKCWIGCRVLME